MSPKLNQTTIILHFLQTVNKRNNTDIHPDAYWSLSKYPKDDRPWLSKFPKDDRPWL